MTLIDGRRARSHESQRLLVEATLRILERAGVGAVSYRSVAREAGVAANAVNYHFGSIDALLLESVKAGAAEWVEIVAGLRVEAFAEDLASLMVHAISANRAHLVAEFELYLLAGRRPALRAAARAWADTLLAPFPDLSEAERCTLTAVIDGLFVQLLLADDLPAVGLLRGVIDGALPERHRAAC